MKVSLNELLPSAVAGAYAIPCFNVFGYEDAVAVLQAAEELGAPVILATNKEMVEFMGTRLLATMLGQLAEQSNQPVCVHLDHCYEVGTALAAIDHGYTSVMFDGSQLSLADNVARSAEVAAYGHRCGVSVEGEIGSVPYSEGRDHIRAVLTAPEGGGPVCT